MDDLPTDVAELRARLVKAREEYRKLLNQRVEFEKRALYNEALVMHALAILNCDQEPGFPPGEYPPADHPLYLAAIEAVSLGAAAVRMRELLLRVAEYVVTPMSVPPDQWEGMISDIAAELRQP
jgi:hypothetical protein